MSLRKYKCLCCREETTKTNKYSHSGFRHGIIYSCNNEKCPVIEIRVKYCKGGVKVIDIDVTYDSVMVTEDDIKKVDSRLRRYFERRSRKRR